jgi:uncharacterized protein YbjT (DUF2867 family)
MRVIVFGATGMVGAGLLREALADRGVEAVLSIGRRSCGVTHPKLRELLLPDLFEIGGVESQLTGWDGCAWALGISSIGLDEAAYARITEDLTLLWARTLLRLNPDFSFCYCSAAGADGSTMWARVRRRVEEGIRAMPFRHAGCVRPAAIAPGPGIRSRVRLYNAGLAVFGGVLPLLARTLPGIATTSERLGRAMLRVLDGQSDKFILESRDINRLGA